MWFSSPEPPLLTPSQSVQVYPGPQIYDSASNYLTVWELTVNPHPLSLPSTFTPNLEFFENKDHICYPWVPKDYSIHSRRVLNESLVCTDMSDWIMACTDMKDWIIGAHRHEWLNHWRAQTWMTWPALERSLAYESITPVSSPIQWKSRLLPNIPSHRHCTPLLNDCEQSALRKHGWWVSQESLDRMVNGIWNRACAQPTMSSTLWWSQAPDAKESLKNQMTDSFRHSALSSLWLLVPSYQCNGIYMVPCNRSCDPTHFKAVSYCWSH